MSLPSPLLLAALLALLPAMPSHAMWCRYQCVGDASCEVRHEKTGDTLQITKARDVENCEPYVGHKGTVAIWYVRNNSLAGKMLHPAEKSSQLMADAANGCQGRLSSCLTAVQRTQVAGISPMSQVQEGSEASGTALGLPFDDVWQPPEGLLLRALAPADGDGSVELIDLSTRQTLARLPIRGGRAQLPPNQLREGQRYQYQWTTPSGTVIGSFTAARAGTVARAERAAAAALADDGVQPKSPEMTRVQKWAAVGLRWDAQRLLQQLEENPP